MIYCIWYPSGGFGHFINAVISLYGDGFSRPGSGFILGHDGNSHNMPLVLPKYRNHQTTPYELPAIDAKTNYTVLIDNGINDESQGFLSSFPSAEVIKICYNDQSWPVVAYTHITKAMGSELNQEVSVDARAWPGKTAWSQREKFFLYLRDHDLRYRWRANGYSKTVNVNQLKNYNSMRHALEIVGITLNDFKPVWDQWWQKNHTYFDPVITAENVITAIIQDVELDLSDVTDLWAQAVVYYFIWLRFNKEVPHNDFADFFANTQQIRQWLRL